MRTIDNSLLTAQDWERIHEAEAKRKRQTACFKALTDEGMQHWFALNVSRCAEYTRMDVPLRDRGNVETRVCHRLTQHGIQAIVPTRKKRVRKGKCRRPRYYAMPALPNIVFCRIPRDAEAISGLRLVRGITSIIGNANGPIAIPDHIMTGFIDLAANGHLDESKLNQNTVSIGERVEITDGPFRDIQAIVRALPNKRLALVEMLLFGRKTKAEIDLSRIRTR